MNDICSVLEDSKVGDLYAQKINDFVSLVAPSEASGMDELIELIKNNRKQVIDLVTNNGVVVFRGFDGLTPNLFNELFFEGLEFESNNAFNLKNMPGFIASWLRKYSETLVGGDYRRYLDKDTVRLGPAGDSIQGPHVEGGVSAERCRFLVLGCLEPSPYMGETGMCDFSQVWKAFPERIQEKFCGSSNLYRYTTRRKITIFDRILLNWSPYTVKTLPSGKAHLVLPPVQAVVRHPETGNPCFQPWSFAINTNASVHRMAQKTFPGRGPIQKDTTAEELNMDWQIENKNGELEGWVQEDHDEVFKTIFEHAYLMQWQKGDVAIVDNVKCGHWRMNGEQGERKIIQIQANSFNAEDNKYETAS